MEISRRQALAAGVGVAVLGLTETVKAQITNPDPLNYEIHSGCSGFILLQNSDGSWSLRIVSEDGNTSIKYIRASGPDAFVWLGKVRQMLIFQTEALGLPLA